MQILHGKRTVLNTNGELLKSFCARNNSLPFDVIGISLDGADSEMHCAMRGLRANFARTLDAARWVASSGHATLKIATVVSRVNSDNITKLAVLVRTLKPAVWRLYQYSPRGHWNRGEARHPIGEAEFYDIVEEATAIVAPVPVSASTAQVNAGCLLIDPEGNVLHASEKSYEVIGNCLKESIEDIWRTTADRLTIMSNKQWLLEIGHLPSQARAAGKGWNGQR